VTTLPDVPPEVRRLLASAVDSFEKVEVLVLAWRQPDMVWTVPLAAERVRLPADVVRVAVEELVAGRLLVADATGYRFAPVTEDDRAAAVRLCELYETDRILVLNVMTTLAMDRIRSSVARTFADAFRLRRGDRGGKGGSDA